MTLSVRRLLRKGEMAVPTVGVAENVAPGLRRLLAPNPGPMTHWGTNTFIIGAGEVAIVADDVLGPAPGAQLARADVRVVVLGEHRLEAAGHGGEGEVGARTDRSSHLAGAAGSLPFRSPFGSLCRGIPDRFGAEASAVSRTRLRRLAHARQS